MTRTYQIERPSKASLQATAAALRRADDAATAATTDLARTQAARLAADDRQHAAAQVLPAEWRTRDRTKAAEWPERGDLDTWRAIGASHAIKLLALPSWAQAAFVKQEPYALAYCQGYLEIQTGYNMPDQHHHQNPVAIAADRHHIAEQALGQYLLTGNVGDLAPDDRAQLIVALAKHVGLDPLERPFGLMKDKGTWVVYARAACADGLCRERGLSTSIMGGIDVIMVCGHEQLTCKAVCKVETTGRSTEAIAALPTSIFTRDKGWHMPDPAGAANLYMKVTTKARRRAVLSCVGLGGMPDVTELETMDVANVGRHYTADPEEETYDIEPPHTDEAGA